MATKKKKSESEPEPAPVEELNVEAGDAHVVLAVNGEKFRLEPAQVAYCARNLTRASNDLHIPSNA